MRSRAAWSSSSPFHSASPIAGRLGIEADIPGEIDVGRLDQRLDLDLDREQMRDPPLDHLAERREPAPPGGEIERHVEEVAALPIGFGIVVVEHVDLARSGQAKHRDKRRDRLRRARP